MSRSTITDIGALTAKELGALTAEELASLSKTRGGAGRPAPSSAALVETAAATEGPQPPPCVSPQVLQVPVQNNIVLTPLPALAVPVHNEPIPAQLSSFSATDSSLPMVKQGADVRVGDMPKPPLPASDHMVRVEPPAPEFSAGARGQEPVTAPPPAQKSPFEPVQSLNLSGTQIGSFSVTPQPSAPLAAMSERIEVEGGEAERAGGLEENPAAPVPLSVEQPEDSPIAQVVEASPEPVVPPVIAATAAEPAAPSFTPIAAAGSLESEPLPARHMPERQSAPATMPVPSPLVMQQDAILPVPPAETESAHSAALTIMDITKLTALELHGLNAIRTDPAHLRAAYIDAPDAARKADTSTIEHSNVDAPLDQAEAQASMPMPVVFPDHINAFFVGGR